MGRVLAITAASHQGAMRVYCLYFQGRTHTRTEDRSAPCSSTNTPPPQTAAGLHSHRGSPDHGGARLAPLQTASRRHHTQALLHLNVENVTVALPTLWLLRHFCSQTAATAVQRLVALVTGHVHMVSPCSCLHVSNFTVVRHTSSSLLQGGVRPHPCQTNETWGVKRTWARRGLPRAGAP